MPKDVVFGVKFDDSGLKDGQKQIDTSVASMSKRFASGGGSAKDFAAAVGAIAAPIGVVTVAVGGLILVTNQLVKSTAEYASEIQHAADMTALSLGTYQKLANAFVSIGVEATEVEGLMGGLIGQIDATIDGSEDMAKSFATLNVELYDTNGALRSQEDILKDTILGLSKMDDVTRRNAIASKLLSTSGEKLSGILNMGSDAIERNIFANEKAVVVSQELADSSVRYNDAMRTIGNTLTKAKNEAITPVVELFADLAETFLNSEFANSPFVEAFESVLIAAQNLGAPLRQVLFDLGLLDDKYLQSAKQRKEEAEAAEKRHNDFAGRISTQKDVISSLNTELLTLSKNFANLDNEKGALRVTGQRRKMALDHIASQKEGYAGDKEALEARIVGAQKELELIRSQEKASKEKSDTGGGSDGGGKKTKSWIDELSNMVDKQMLLIEGSVLHWQKNNEKIIDLTQVAVDEVDAIWDSVEVVEAIVPDDSIQKAAERYDAIVSISIDAANTVISIGNTIASSAINSDSRELSSWRKKEQSKLNGLQVTSRRKAQLQKKIDAETEAREKEIEKKRLKLRLANVITSTASGIAGTWAQALGSAPPPVAIPMAIGSSALMAGVGIAQGAEIASQMQGLFTGGVIGGSNATPTTSGGDDTMIMGKKGEYVLNASQQQELYNTIFNGGGGAGGGTTINIENFSGGDNELSKLEDMLTELKANGREVF